LVGSTGKVCHEIAAAAIYKIIIPVAHFAIEPHERYPLKVGSAQQERIKPMPERFAVVSGILDVFVMFALLVVSAIHTNIEDYHYRKTLTSEQLEDHLETIRREMNIW
jgi:hypothetical protein